MRERDGERVETPKRNLAAINTLRRFATTNEKPNNLNLQPIKTQSPCSFTDALSLGHAANVKHNSKLNQNPSHVSGFVLSTTAHCT
jgi:hypothetical protein